MNDDGRNVSGENHAKKNSCRRTRSSYRFLGNHAPSADGESPRLHRDDSARGGGGGGGGEEGEDAHIQVDRASSLFRVLDPSEAKCHKIKIRSLEKDELWRVAAGSRRLASPRAPARIASALERESPFSLAFVSAFSFVA